MNKVTVEAIGELNCSHDFDVMDTSKNKEDRSFGMPTWTRIDRFYCKKCLEIRRYEQSESNWEKPNWY